MRKVCFLIVLGSLLVLLSVGCNSAGEESGTNNNDKSDTIPLQKTIPPSLPYNIELTFPEGVPSLNKEAILTCTINTTIILANMNVEIKLPESVALVSGNVTWQGNLKPGESVSFSPVIIFNEIGHWTITATDGSDIATIYLDIGADHSQFGWPPEMPEVTIVE